MCWRPETEMIHELKREKHTGLQSTSVHQRPTTAGSYAAHPASTHSLFLPLFPLHSPEPLPEACAHKDKTLERSSCGATGTSLSFTPVMTHWSLIRTQQRHQRHFLPEHWLQGISCRCPTYRKHFCLNGINIKQNWAKVKVVTFLTDTGSWTGTGAPGGGGGNDRALWLLLSRTKCWVDDVTFVLSG